MNSVLSVLVVGPSALWQYDPTSRYGVLTTLLSLCLRALHSDPVMCSHCYTPEILMLASKL